MCEALGSIARTATKKKKKEERKKNLLQIRLWDGPARCPLGEVSLRGALKQESGETGPGQVQPLEMHKEVLEVSPDCLPGWQGPFPKRIVPVTNAKPSRGNAGPRVALGDLRCGQPRPAEGGETQPQTESCGLEG